MELTNWCGKSCHFKKLRATQQHLRNDAFVKLIIGM